MKVDLVDFDYQKDFFELLKNVGELKKIGWNYKKQNSTLNLKNRYPYR